jgi:hypothetical protein
MGSNRTRGLAIALSTLAALAAPAAADAATYYLSPTGSDANACTVSSKCLTLTRAQAVATSGDTVQIADGNYGAVATRTTFSDAGVTFVGEGTGESRPNILGESVVTGVGARVSNMIFDGPTGDVNGNGDACSIDESGVLWVNATGVRVDHSEVRDSLGHFGIFVSSNAHTAQVDNNWVHDNGCNLDAIHHHGMYLSADNGVIENNLIEDSQGWGLHFYSSPEGWVAKYNTLVNNGHGGVILATETSANNVIANNVLTGNGFSYTNRPGAIRCYTGTGNTAVNNLYFNNEDRTDGGQVGGDSTGSNGSCATVSGNVNDDPDYTTNYQLASTSPAIGLASLSYTTTLDYFGDTRDVDPDSGYDEHSETPSG